MKPNILVIFADQMRGDTLGCAGHPCVRTPHLDALAAGGVHFTHACTPDPICVPARASFTTGNYPYPLRITGSNHDVVEENCRDCHAPMVVAMNAGADAPRDEVLEHATGMGIECSRCHRHVGHWVR